MWPIKEKISLVKKHNFGVNGCGRYFRHSSFDISKLHRLCVFNKYKRILLSIKILLANSTKDIITFNSVSVPHNLMQCFC